MVKQYLEIF